MKKIILFIGTLVAVLAVMAQAKVTVNITEVESDKGDVYFNIFKSDEGFPSEWDKAYRQHKLKSRKGQLSYTFEDLPYGIYAISIAHDENGNGEVDTNFIGMPKEPVGASNQTGFGKPSFSRSKFELSQSNPAKSLKMNFLN